MCHQCVVAAMAARKMAAWLPHHHPQHARLHWRPDGQRAQSGCRMSSSTVTAPIDTSGPRRGGMLAPVAKASRKSLRSAS
jgi:hypothetical protein